MPSLRKPRQRAYVVAGVAALAAVAIAAFAIDERGAGGDPERAREQPRFVAAERARASAYAAEFAHSCRSPCRVHRVEPVAPGG